MSSLEDTANLLKQIRAHSKLHRPRQYTLKEHEIIPCEDILEWGDWFQNAERHVALTWVTSKVYVSTAFLGLDHNYSWEGPPVLFESMVFGASPFNMEVMARYTEWDHALAGHQKILTRVKKSLWQRLRKRKQQTSKIQNRPHKCEPYPMVS